MNALGQIGRAVPKSAPPAPTAETLLGEIGANTNLATNRIAALADSLETMANRIYGVPPDQKADCDQDTAVAHGMAAELRDQHLALHAMIDRAFAALVRLQGVV